MTELEPRLGYTFKNPDLLKTALTHSSYANENRHEGECNERLEFLGDAVLGVIVARYLYLNYPNLAEGKMTRLRAELVCEKNLNEVAIRLELGKFLRLGKGEESGGGRYRTSILADAVEAVLAAIYLDSGTDEAEKFVNKFIISVFESGQTELDRDYKTDLQELVQRKNGQLLEYTLVGESGPDHAKTFTIAVKLNGKELATGTGKSKKSAEQAAAKAALGIL
jgi:ribonuclease-3